MEKKAFHSYAVKTGDEGIVEAIVAVMGNVDEGGDMIHPGAFTKTISERLGKIKVLDAHRTDSTARLIGKPLEMREVSKGELPPEVLAQYPEASGALWVKTQFLMNTPEGAGAFERIKSGVLDEWSIGYDALDKDYSKVTQKDGKEVQVRNLRTIKLYEYSPVLWGMNPATSTLSAKRTAEKAEKAETAEMDGKPWRAVHEGSVWKVYKLDEEGNPTGEALGEHETEEEAQAQVRALYANEDEKSNREEREGREDSSSAKEMTERGPVQRLGHVLQGTIHRTFTTLCDDWYTAGLLNTEERIMLSGLIGDALGILEQGIPEEIALREPYAGMGMMPFLMMAIGGPEESKSGRVLAARNAKRIMDALALLQEALTDAGLMGAEALEPEADDEEEEGEEDKTLTPGPSPKGRGGRSGRPETDDEAGPQDKAPTSNGGSSWQLDLQRLIEIELEEIKLLEV